MTDVRLKFIFVSTVLSVWVVVVTASLYTYLFKGGPLPDPVLLGIPTGTWLAVYPPLPRTMKEKQDAST